MIRKLDMLTDMMEDTNIEDDDLASMTIEDIKRQSHLLDNEIRVFKEELQRTNLELDSFKDKIKENQEKIKLNKQLPYLVGNIVESTVGKDKQIPQGTTRTTSDVDHEEFCEKYYEKLLPIMADKYEHERRKKEKLEEVIARLDFGDVRKRTTKRQESAYSKSRTRSPRRHRRSHSPRQSSSVFARLKRERSRSPRHNQKNKARKESNIFERLGSRGWSVSAYSDSHPENSRYTEKHSESEDSGGGHWKSKSQKQKPGIEDDDLSSHGSKDHLKNLLQAAAKTEEGHANTVCHIVLTPHHYGNHSGYGLRSYLSESIDSYDDLREAFWKNYSTTEKMHQRHTYSTPEHQAKEMGNYRRLHTKVQVTESGTSRVPADCMRIFESPCTESPILSLSKIQ
ncbi:reverse transcriptase domain-containing protein [Tanacetum coccineum]